jgi:bifunctional UDP-N-acetylglucosamine pyrophosphorylase / glucosamine-1-phosphate N-acetyltransferase
MKKLNVVIMAAGKGTRMKSSLPKVLHPIGGMPIIQRVVQAARALHPERIIVVVGHGQEAVKAALSTTRPDQDLHFAAQWPEQLGTGHAVQQAVPLIDNDATVLILNGDVPLVSTATLARLRDVGDNGAVALLTAHLPDAKHYGRVTRSTQGAVTGIVEYKNATETQRKITEWNAGMYAAPGAALKRWLGTLTNANPQGEYLLTDIVAQAVAEGVQVAATSPINLWEVDGVNDKVELAALERMYQTTLAHHWMRAVGAHIVDPQRFDARGDFSCSADVTIDINCVFEGDVNLGQGVKVGAHCLLKNVEVRAGTEILPFTHIEGAGAGEARIKIGANCRIGPYARIRPGTVLAEEVHIGNFVEVKNAQVAAQSKANHLAYVGDATVGSRVNIGAGTITCNYDGVNKHRTIIEDDVFIGSDTQLVAPVTVRRGATLGAGTTLTSEAPADKLTLSRAKQLTLERWKRPEKKKS